MATASSNPTTAPLSPALNSSVAGEVSVPWTMESVITPSTSLSQEQMGEVSGVFSPSKAVAFQDSVDSELESSENSVNGKKPAWNKPNGAFEVSPMMGADSWPALSESTKASPKFSYDSLKTPDGSVAQSQGPAIGSTSSPKHVHTNTTSSDSTPNNVPSRHRYNKRAGGNSSNSSLANGSVSQTQQQQNPAVEAGPNSAGKSGMELFSRDNVHRDGGHRGGFGPQSLGGNEHQHQRNSPRKGNSRGRPRGDGFQHHAHGGGRDQERGNQEWHHNRSFGSRDSHLPPPRVPPVPFIRPPPPSSPFIPPLMPMHPLGSPLGYPEVPSHLYYAPLPHPDSPVIPMLAPLPPGQPMLYPIPDPLLISKLVNQIHYYFSSENLVKDIYLRREMDEQGWVPVKFIASFKKVAELTDNIQLILNALRTSSVVEVQGEKLRLKNDWKKWILPPSVQFSISSPQSAQSPRLDALGQHLQNVSLHTNEHGNGEASLSRSSSEQSGYGGSVTPTSRN